MISQPSVHRLLAPLGAEGRELVVPHLKPLEHRRGAVLIERGAPMRALHFVSDGLVAVMARAADDATVAVGLIGPGRWGPGTEPPRPDW